MKDGGKGWAEGQEGAGLWRAFLAEARARWRARGGRLGAWLASLPEGPALGAAVRLLQDGGGTLARMAARRELDAFARIASVIGAGHAVALALAGRVAAFDAAMRAGRPQAARRELLAALAEGS